MLRSTLVFGLASSALAACPATGEPPIDHPHVPVRRHLANSHRRALSEVSFAAVKKDLIDMMTSTNSEAWPADYGHYGPLFVRLSWHNAGSYRAWDGRGGADGGRQRFDPERSWADNTNLDKARALLAPIKAKYGAGLSWGDLFVLAGTAAIEAMGGPVLGFCGGRIDDEDGSASMPLGAPGQTPEQEALAPCPVDGDCPAPLGQKVLGLIYVNPEGPHANPDPALSAPNVRGTFGRMHMNDTETVALIGGGHAFGKTHGACPAGAGPAPNEDEENPWPGLCGTGKGADAVTSGFEGPWTTNPTKWDNGYFRLLTKYEWQVAKGPGGHWQWHIKDDVARGVETAARAHGETSVAQPVMMLTSDISLKTDPDYLKISTTFANDQGELDKAFSHAWYKLMSRDMGPHARCAGDLVPPPQLFQLPLPPPPSAAVDQQDLFNAVSESIARTPANGGYFLSLALACATSFRETDYVGGCNGALIRFAQSQGLERNKGLDLDKAVAALSPIKGKFGDDLTWADLIVFAGNTVLETAGVKTEPFCSGRSDAPTHNEHVLLPTHKAFGFKDVVEMKEAATLMGLSVKEMVALNGAFHSLALSPTKAYLSTDYFEKVLAGGKGLSSYDKTLLLDPSYKDAVQAFSASDGHSAYMAALASAWSKLATADMFDGPYGNKCDARTPSSTVAPTTYPKASTSIDGSSMALGAAFALGVLVGGTTLAKYWGKSHAVAPMQ